MEELTFRTLETDAEVVRSRSGMRQRLLRADQQRVLIADLSGSTESDDEYTRLNCEGFGRRRRFSKFSIHLRSRGSDGLARPHYRGLPPVVPYETQVFQLAGCNWACWYCFVDDSLLDGRVDKGKFLTAADLLDLYLEQEDRPAVLDLSGGQPDIVPEWCLWMLEEVARRGLRDKVHVWIDDNLSGRFMRTYLSSEQIRYMAEFPKHSRVGCFKGYDIESFRFNTGAQPSGFATQFSVMRDLIADGFDTYAYATFTGPVTSMMEKSVTEFVDRLQEIDPNLPLRTIPLEVRPYSAAVERVGNTRQEAFDFQYDVVEAWEHELALRFTHADLNLPYEEVALPSTDHVS